MHGSSPRGGAELPPHPRAGRRRWLQWSAALGATLLAARHAGQPAHAAPLAPMRAGRPQPLALEYDGYLDLGGNPMRIARGRLQFVPSGADYRLTMNVDSAIAELAYESTGQLEPQGLHPLRYRESRRIGGRSPRERSVRFDAAPPPAPADGSTAAEPVLVVPAGAQDRISLLVQLSLLAQANPKRFAEGAELELALAGLEHVDQIRLRVGPVERVETAGGVREAQRIRRFGEEPGSAGLEFWLGSDALRTPVVIRFDDDGRSLKFVLR